MWTKELSDQLNLAHLLPLTGSAHGELGFNRWKKIWGLPISACQFATLEL